MKNIEFSSHMGPFAYTASTDIGDSVNEVTTNLAIRGLADICFRATANEAMKALVKSGHLGVDDKKKPLSRDQAEYNDESVIVFSDAANAALEKLALADENPLPEITLRVTGKYEAGQSEASRKMAEKVLALYDAAPEAKQVSFAVVYGFEMDDTRDAKIAAIHAHIGAMREPRKAKATTAEAAPTAE